MEHDLSTFNTFTISTVNRVDITSTTSRHQPPTSPPQFLIHFNFSCKSVFSFSLFNSYSPDHHQPLDDSLPPQVCSTVLGLSELLNRRLLRQRLRSWFPFRPRWWQHLWVDQVLERAWEDVGSMPASHNAVVIDFRVFVHHAMVCYEEVAGLEAADDGGNFMVPAAEAWIESVMEKKIVVDSSGTCTVCLDDFSGGSEGVSMPCAHVFHGDCIAEWLRTSHYCPVCRSEFPTD